MITYEGRRTRMGPIVTVDGDLLNLRLDLRNHNPIGFDWGYCGSSPAQLALAILADHLENNEEALDLYQRFKWVVITELPKKGWKLNSQQIDEAIQRIREQEGKSH